MTQDTKDELQVAEDVSMRLQGLRKWVVHASETAYYRKEVWAESRGEAFDKADELDWTDPVDYGDFNINSIEDAQ